MKKLIFSVITIMMLSLTGCISPYQPSGLGGGYTDMALSNDTYFVTFRGNGFTSSDVVQSYALRRAAELTLNKGFKFFVVLNGGTNATSAIIRTPATVQTHTSGNLQGSGFGNTSFSGNNAFSNFNYSGYGSSNSYTTINPGNEYEVNRYKSGITIKMLHSNKVHPQAFDAAIILSNYQK
jgi:hypothetical protein